jgi:hypothetical protein
MQTPTEMADEAVICYTEGDFDGFNRWREELVLCGHTHQQVDRLLASAGLPDREQLVSAEVTSAPHHRAFAQNQFLH